MAFMPSKDQLPQSSTTYLMKWLEVATKGNVVLHSHMVGAIQSMTIFKCNKCQQNWHVGDHLFYPSVADPGKEFIPSELQDWVKEHRHVCKKYEQSLYSGVIGTDCKNCHWPYGAHEESWANAPQYQNIANDPGYQNSIALQQMQYKADNGLAGEFSKDFLANYKNQDVKYKFTYSVNWPEPAPEPEKPKPIPPLPEPKGRKFR
jgi:hypothetical protein